MQDYELGGVPGVNWLVSVLWEQVAVTVNVKELVWVEVYCATIFPVITTVYVPTYEKSLVNQETTLVA